MAREFFNDTSNDEQTNHSKLDSSPVCVRSGLKSASIRVKDCLLTVTCAGLVMFLLVQLEGNGNLTPIMLTGLVGLQAHVLVNDPTIRAKKITTCLFSLMGVWFTPYCHQYHRDLPE